MAIYFTRRVLQSLFTLIVISMILYGLISSVPGGFMSAYTERSDFTQEDLARIRTIYGLDDPVPVRYFKWLHWFGDVFGAGFRSGFCYRLGCARLSEERNGKKKGKDYGKAVFHVHFIRGQKYSLAGENGNPGLFNFNGLAEPDQFFGETGCIPMNQVTDKAVFAVLCQLFP